MFDDFSKMQIKTFEVRIIWWKEFQLLLLFNWHRLAPCSHMNAKTAPLTQRSHQDYL